MADTRLRPLTADDLPFLHEVRHHPETLRWLHDDRAFALADVRRWYEDSRPEWYVVLAGDERVGYVRTSDRDERNGSIKVGADVHPDHRRRGYGRAAYRLLLERLRREGFRRVWLEVLSGNEAAMRLYERIGFRREGCKVAAVHRDGRWQDSILMSIVDPARTRRAVKVVVVWLGARRRRPRDARETFDLLRFLLDREEAVDPRLPCDTLLVHNESERPDEVELAGWWERCRTLLASADGRATRRGELRVVERENLGLSFGGFDHAFRLYADRYDHWFFTEDDQVPVRDGYLSTAVDQLESDPTIGFVAVVGVATNRAHPPCAHGGVGVAPRDVLRAVKAAHPSTRHPDGHLPYHAVPGYEGQETLGEVRFTNAIHRLGFRLVDLAMHEVCVSWGDPRRRTPRMVPWDESWTTSARVGGTV